MYKAAFYFLMIITVPIYSAYFFSLIYSATVVQFFGLQELSLQQAYCVTALAGFLTTKYKSEKSDLIGSVVFCLIYPPVAYGAISLIAWVIR